MLFSFSIFSNVFWALLLLFIRSNFFFSPMRKNECIKWTLNLNGCVNVFICYSIRHWLTHMCIFFLVGFKLATNVTSPFKSQSIPMHVHWCCQWMYAFVQFVIYHTKFPRIIYGYKCIVDIVNLFVDNTKHEYTKINSQNYYGYKHWNIVLRMRFIGFWSLNVFLKCIISATTSGEKTYTQGKHHFF